MMDGSERFSDREWVARLIENDHSTWTAMVADMVLPLTRTRKFLEILAKANESSETVVSELYLDLQKDEARKLRNFRFEGPFRGWLYFQVRNALKVVVRKSQASGVTGLSDEAIDSALSECTVRGGSAVDLPDEIELGEVCFSRLWRLQPKHALVLLLRTRLELSSADVCLLLGLSSANNVDQMNRRAKLQMARFREEGLG